MSREARFFFSVMQWKLYERLWMKEQTQSTIWTGQESTKIALTKESVAEGSHVGVGRTVEKVEHRTDTDNETQRRTYASCTPFGIFPPLILLVDPPRMSFYVPATGHRLARRVYIYTSVYMHDCYLLAQHIYYKKKRNAITTCTLIALSDAPLMNPFCYLKGRESHTHNLIRLFLQISWEVWLLIILFILFWLVKSLFYYYFIISYMFFL
jgi:hypothetical protein